MQANAAVPAYMQRFAPRRTHTGVCTHRHTHVQPHPACTHHHLTGDVGAQRNGDKLVQLVLHLLVKALELDVASTLATPAMVPRHHS